MRAHPLLCMALIACAHSGHRALQGPSGLAVGLSELAPVDALTGAPLNGLVFYPTGFFDEALAR